ncbi:MAG TPA: electron transfer flavoprotein subunit alpha [Anaerolineaceae bacterium]|nr:electron transfer flavoprotein subunit alpha [Anaerolineaceae bacterium]HOA21964.1 electron transfer flavoprotein subunit alpha [Anaerolineaceae bacterium]
MSEIRVVTEKCTGCRLCLPACPYGAISMSGKKALISAACVFCGACVPVCRFDAIELFTEKPAWDEAPSSSGIWVFAEQVDGKVKPVVLELLGEASALARKKASKITAVWLGPDAPDQLQCLIAQGADEVIAVTDARLAERDELLYPQVLARLAVTYRPEIFLVGATGFGRSIAPRAASALDTGLTADCTRLDIDPQSGLLLQTRPAFGGNLLATILCRTRRPQMATVRPKVMQALPADYSRSGNVRMESMDLSGMAGLCIESTHVNREDGPGLDNAEVVVGIGRGIGSARQVKLYKHLAAALGAGLAASRAVVDLGWVDYSHQVGQTGITIAPKVYLAFGISGSVQHMAGLSENTHLVAVNKDKNAPIFAVADERVRADCNEVAAALLRQLGGDAARE